MSANLLPALDPRMVRVAENWFHVRFPEGELIRPVGLIVGERPGPRSNPNPHFAMWPWPPGSAGGRLYAWSGLDAVTYLSRLARTNLQPEAIGRWNKAAAMSRAIELWMTFRRQRREDWPRFVLCGARVAEAFGLDPVTWFQPIDRDGVSYVAIPHPSGRNPVYNDETSRRLAGQMVRWAARMDESEGVA